MNQETEHIFHPHQYIDAIVDQLDWQGDRDELHDLLLRQFNKRVLQVIDEHIESYVLAEFEPRFENEEFSWEFIGDLIEASPQVQVALADLIEDYEKEILETYQFFKQ